MCVDGNGFVDALDRSIIWNKRNLVTTKPNPRPDIFNLKQKNDNRNKEKGKETMKDKQSGYDLKLDGPNSKKKNKSE